MKNLTTKLSFAAALTLTLATTGAPIAQAQEAAPVHAVSFNATLTSEYRYRGISQSRLNPAIQGGVDYTHNPTGFYIGTWASSIKWIEQAGGDGKVELDIYGGKRGEIAPGLSYDVGYLRYLYPSDKLAVNADTSEVYGQLSYGPGYIKYSHSTTNLFGFSDSKNSGYLDISANFDVATGLMLNLHVGRQRVAHNSGASYNDYKIGLTKDLGFASVSAAVYSADTDAYVVNGKDLAKTRAVVAISKTF